MLVSLVLRFNEIVQIAENRVIGGAELIKIGVIVNAIAGL